MKDRNIVDSFNDAIEGLIKAFRSERNMKIHFCIALIVLAAAIFFNLSRIETILIFIAITFVIMAEMINTAIEKVVDMIHEDYHPLAKIAKNVAAGAVLVSAINAMVVGYVLFYDKIDRLSLSLISRIKTMPVHITAASLLIVTIAVIIIKNINKRGTFLRGGMPSGHSALAFSLFTCITLIASNALISGLSMLIALMVLHSRYESGVHTMYEMVIGAILGIILTVLAFQIAKL
ncbi:MAG: phosphatase PAP2 family protein [Clostridiales bacterium]|nr:phosphatase PAP2 family protein [Clostridiales bacterium]